MCMVSVLSAAGSAIPAGQWTPPVYSEFKDIMARLDALDAKLDQPHCDDPAKAAWMREVEARLATLEKP